MAIDTNMHFAFNSRPKLLEVRPHQCCASQIAEASSLIVNDAGNKISREKERCIFHEVKQHTHNSNEMREIEGSSRRPLPGDFLTLRIFLGTSSVAHKFKLSDWMSIQKSQRKIWIWFYLHVWCCVSVFCFACGRDEFFHAREFQSGVFISFICVLAHSSDKFRQYISCASFFHSSGVPRSEKLSPRRSWRESESLKSLGG